MGSVKFELLDSDMNILQRTTNGSIITNGENTGKAPILFDSTPITSDGTFTYYIKETQGNNDEIQYDNKTIKATVTVINEHGFLRANTHYEIIQ